MSTELSVLPEPWTIERAYTYYGDRYIAALPYQDKNYLLRVMAERSITMPFSEIVSRCDGMSVCNKCGARYTGQAERCMALVWKRKGSYNWEQAKLCDFSERYAILEMQPCDTSNLTWSHGELFSAQQDFFSFVAWIGTLPTRHEGQLKKYEHLLPPGSADEYRMLALEKAALDLEMRVSRALAGMEMIAQKMNAAGHQLCF